MNETDSITLRGMPLFAEMEKKNFEAMLEGAYVQDFPAGVKLISEGEPGDMFYVLLSGEVDLFGDWNGNQTTMATVRPVSTFILAAAIRESSYLMSARTLQRSRLILLPSIDLRRIFEIDKGFARAAVAELALCYHVVVKNAKDLKLRSSLERLANYLVRQYHRSGESEQFELRTEKQRLASFLGMTPENLSRAIKTLRDHGVEISGSKVTITDFESLMDLAKPTPLIDDPRS